MSVITIAKDVYAGGNAVAARVAEKLGYDCVHREVYQQAADQYGMAADKLEQALRTGPGFFGMSLATRKRCVAYVRAVLASRFLEDELVYAGPFGAWLVAGVSHVLRVRLTASVDARVGRAAKHEGLSSRAAAKHVRAADQAHKEIAELLFKMDPADESRLDLVVDTTELDVNDAAERITTTLADKRYQPMTYSKELLLQVQLAYRVEAQVADIDPDAEAKVDGSKVRLRARAGSRSKAKTTALLEERVRAVDGVDEVDAQLLDETLSRTF